MAGRLQGKTAFMTAAGQGIGRAIAEAFIAEGATVIATDLDLAKLAGLDKAKTFALDVTKTDAVNVLAEKVLKEIGTPNVLGNFAGWVHQGSILECSDADWDRSFDVNVKSMHRVLRAFVPAMLKNGGGSIINIASVASSVRGLPKRYAYGTTKAAVIGLTKAMAADFIKQGLRVNAICPGTIQSPSLDQRIATNAKATGKSLDAVRQDFIDRQPIGRLGTPEEIAAGAVFLASDDSSYYTGQTFQIDGGMTI
jgi:2-keto-3-deoxy-L-fuconate dehydrogenase